MSRSDVPAMGSVNQAATRAAAVRAGGIVRGKQRRGHAPGGVEEEPDAGEVGEEQQPGERRCASARTIAAMIGVKSE